MDADELRDKVADSFSRTWLAADDCDNWDLADAAIRVVCEAIAEHYRDVERSCSSCDDLTAISAYATYSYVESLIPKEQSCPRI